MTIRTMGSALILLLVVGAGPLHAQSIVSQGGLGLPVEALDAHAKALGSVGIGLRSGNPIPGDPGSFVDLGFPTIMFTFQSTTGDFQFGDESGNLEGTRFPVTGIAYPLRRIGVLSATVEGLFDQTWEVFENSSIDLGSGPIDFQDRFESDGGLSVIRLGWSRRIIPEVGVTVQIGRYAGTVRKTFTRRFVSATIFPTVEEGRWSYSGTAFSAGVVVDPFEYLRLAANVDLSSEVTADPREDTIGDAVQFDIPTRIKVGGELALSSVLALHASAAFADWETTNTPEFGLLTAGQTLSFGGGVEWTGGRIFGRSLPLRAGYRSAELPFLFQGEALDESFFTAGFGIRLDPPVEFATDLTGRIDIAGEFGERSGATLKESLTRFSVTFRLSGF